MQKKSKASGIALGAVALAIGTTLMTAPTASAAFTRVCTTIPARDIVVGGNPNAYPPRPGRVIHIRARTICKIVRTGGAAPSFNLNLPPISFNANADAN